MNLHMITRDIDRNLYLVMVDPENTANLSPEKRKREKQRNLAIADGLHRPFKDEHRLVFVAHFLHIRLSV